MPMFSRTIENGRSKYIFELSMPTLISIVGTVALCLVWSFILGIILGRGHSPEEQMPQLARILPGEGSNPAPLVVENNTDNGIMRPEELQFRESLRDGQPRRGPGAQSGASQPSPPAVPAAASAPALPSGAAPASTASTSHTPPAAAPAAARSQSPAQVPTQSSGQASAVNQALAQMERQSKPSAQAGGKPAPSGAAAKPAATVPAPTATVPAPTASSAGTAQAVDSANKGRPGAKPAEPSAVKYDYVYQVAASRDEKQAAAVVQKLASLGLQGRIEKQGDDGWRRILVNFSGTPDDTQKLRETIAKIGIERIIMRDKKEAAKR